MDNICIISHQHLCRNPRVWKEAKALTTIGYKVTILTNIYSSSLLKEDYELLKNTSISYQFYNNLTKKTLLSYWNRGCNKLGRWFNKLGLENKWALGYAPSQCLQKALKLNANLYIAHQELPTFIGTQLIQKGKKVAFDFEDWYTQDLLPKAQSYRPNRLLKKAEFIALSKGVFAYTTSISMANAMKNYYQLKETPTVVYNSFPSYNNKLNLENEPEHMKLIWLSQTIGSNRGLEEIILALNEVKKRSYALYLRGNIDVRYKQSLIALLKNDLHQLHFLSLIPNGSIAQDLTQYNVGLALELNTPLSRDLTLTNKIFHYLSVGLPVIASKTRGQLSLKDDFENDIHYFDTQKELVDILNNFKFSASNARDRILYSYQKKYNWSKQAKTIQKLVSKT